MQTNCTFIQLSKDIFWFVLYSCPSNFCDFFFLSLRYGVGTDCYTALNQHFCEKNSKILFFKWKKPVGSESVISFVKLGLLFLRIINFFTFIYPTFRFLCIYLDWISSGILFTAQSYKSISTVPCMSYFWIFAVVVVS